MGLRQVLEQSLHLQASHPSFIQFTLYCFIRSYRLTRCGLSVRSLRISLACLHSSYMVGYLISLGVKSRLLAVLFTVVGAINLFTGSALTVHLLAQHGFNITSVIESLPYLSIIILVGIAFILAGIRKL